MIHWKKQDTQLFLPTSHKTAAVSLQDLPNLVTHEHSMFSTTPLCWSITQDKMPGLANALPALYPSFQKHVVSMIAEQNATYFVT